MSVKQEPKVNVNPLPPPKDPPPSPAEHQRRYRAKVRQELQAIREIRAIIARLDGEA